LRLGVIDAIVPEPPGGAHRAAAAAIVAVGEAVASALGELRGLDRSTIVRLRQEKFSAIGRSLT
jgi:acetyl-CoA carboxylase carboxyl transferase subunit alpha